MSTTPLRPAGMTARCLECGGPLSPPSCEALFTALLALDHQRVRPFSVFHAVNVACYLLQHPSRSAPRHLPGQLGLVTVFVEDGLPALERLTASRRARNSHRASASHRVTPAQSHAAWPAAGAPLTYATTIHDVAVDSSFPSEGYEQRVTRWARAVHAAYADAVRAPPNGR